jgi:hypothetical protein
MEPDTSRRRRHGKRDSGFSAKAAASRELAERWGLLVLVKVTSRKLLLNQLQVWIGTCQHLATLREIITGVARNEWAPW